jgi:hypothetical protein
MRSFHITCLRLAGVVVLCALVAACATPSQDVSLYGPCAPTLVTLGLRF